MLTNESPKNEDDTDDDEGLNSSQTLCLGDVAGYAAHPFHPAHNYLICSFFCPVINPEKNRLSHFH